MLIVSNLIQWVKCAILTLGFRKFVQFYEKFTEFETFEEISRSLTALFQYAGLVLTNRILCSSNM